MKYEERNIRGGTIQDMIDLIDSIEINAPPEKVYECLLSFIKDKESYKSWHPEHEDITWVKGEPCKVGSVMCIQEWLNGHLQKLNFRVTRIIPNKLFEYRALFPLSIIAEANKFTFEPKGENDCIFTASGRVRFPMWLFLIMHKEHKGKLKGSEKHMKEEGENLKKVLEETK